MIIAKKAPSSIFHPKLRPIEALQAAAGAAAASPLGLVAQRGLAPRRGARAAPALLAVPRRGDGRPQLLVLVSMWLWLGIQREGLAPQVLVQVSTYQGSQPILDFRFFEPPPCVGFHFLSWPQKVNLLFWGPEDSGSLFFWGRVCVEDPGTTSLLTKACLVCSEASCVWPMQ